MFTFSRIQFVVSSKIPGPRKTENGLIVFATPIIPTGWKRIFLKHKTEI